MATHVEADPIEEGSVLEKFLHALEKEFPDAKALWQLASYQTKERYCPVWLIGENRVCCLSKVEGVCPYHRDSRYDFLRNCTFIHNDGETCQSSIRSRDLTVLWCEAHLSTPKQNVRLKRVGDHIVIKDTPYAISSDLQSIIGRVEASYNLEFTLSRVRDAMMEEVANKHGFLIRLEE